MHHRVCSNLYSVILFREFRKIRDLCYGLSYMYICMSKCVLENIGIFVIAFNMKLDMYQNFFLYILHFSFNFERFIFCNDLKIDILIM